jgi:acyl-coenzyme A thioesterase 9
MASAIFLFAARNKDDYSKSYRLPKFLYDGEEDIEKCHMRYQLGLKRQLERKQHARDSIVLKAPNQQEIEYVHRFFTNEAEKEGKLAISETHLQKTLLMHTQDRNLHGKIFGGYIMREAFEIG